MDEPNASLDEAGDRQLMQTMQKLKAAKATVIFTTHRAEYINMADNLLVLNAGKQTAFGPVADMLASARKMRDAKQSAQPQAPAQAAAQPTATPVAAPQASVAPTVAAPAAAPKSPEAVTGAAA
jgi:ABC-type protease/lipase transport system fused ATPase/permease subunit